MDGPQLDSEQDICWRCDNDPARCDCTALDPPDPEPGGMTFEEALDDAERRHGPRGGHLLRNGLAGPPARRGAGRRAGRGSGQVQESP